MSQDDFIASYRMYKKYQVKCNEFYGSHIKRRKASRHKRVKRKRKEWNKRIVLRDTFFTRASSNREMNFSSIIIIPCRLMESKITKKIEPDSIMLLLNQKKLLLYMHHNSFISVISKGMDEMSWGGLDDIWGSSYEWHMFF